MQDVSSTYIAANFASVRKVKAKVELYSGSTLVDTYTDEDKIISLDIQRVGEDGKFFGFGICHRLNIHLIDTQRVLDISTANTLKIGLGPKLATGVEYMGLPLFKVSEVHRDEKTNELSITAYDAIYGADTHTVAELELEAPYTLKEFGEAVGALLGVSVSGVDGFTLSYPEGANFEGTESIREALNMMAEATQTIYYLNAENTLTFKRLDRDGNAIFTIDKSKYFELKSSGSRRLQTICNATELGDNVSESTSLIGSTQYVRDNAFWELRADIATLVHNAVEAMGNITIEQMECNWRGDASLEIGDKIELITKDDEVITSYLLNDTLTYSGALNEKTIWKYADNDNETASNPTSIGDALKQTYAKVDKANKEIEIVASSVEENKQEISQLHMETNGIRASVSNVQSNLDNMVDSLDNRIDEVEKKAELAITPEQVEIKISEAMAGGASSVKTETGFHFDNEGLTISKTDSEISTNIDEDGMSIMKGSEEVLTADNTGVQARNLHANTYLIIGANSRFEDYGSDRTGCFWIGG